MEVGVEVEVGVGVEVKLFANRQENSERRIYVQKTLAGAGFHCSSLRHDVAEGSGGMLLHLGVCAVEQRHNIRPAHKE